MQPVGLHTVGAGQGRTGVSIRSFPELILTDINAKWRHHLKRINTVRQRIWIWVCMFLYVHLHMCMYIYVCLAVAAWIVIVPAAAAEHQ